MPRLSALENLSKSLPPWSMWPENLNYEALTNRRCPDDITAIEPWLEFNYDNLMEEYGKALSDLKIEVDDRSKECAMLPPFPNKATFLWSAWSIIQDRLDPALLASTKKLASRTPESHLTPVSVTMAHEAAPTKTYTPDLAIVAAPPSGNWTAKDLPPNRAPGWVHVSWKWKSTWGNSDESRKCFYLLGLSRAKLFMEMCGTRYGFILTDEEFVAIKRDDASGRLALSEAIPWTSGGTGKMSLLLGLWYLIILAAKSDWKLEG